MCTLYCNVCAPESFVPRYIWRQNSNCTPGAIFRVFTSQSLFFCHNFQEWFIKHRYTKNSGRFGKLSCGSHITSTCRLSAELLHFVVWKVAANRWRRQNFSAAGAQPGCSGVTRVGVTRGGNWWVSPYFFFEKSDHFLNFRSGVTPWRVSPGSLRPL